MNIHPVDRVSEGTAKMGPSFIGLPLTKWAGG
jgi:hypothetical protein